MKGILATTLVVALAILLGVQASRPAYSRQQHDLVSTPAPEFTHRDPADWINSEPLMLGDLGGRVVLVDFWTYECWNCYRSFPWLKELQAHFAGRPFTIVGVHTPEFEREHDRDNVKQKVAEFGLDHPVMLDNDFSYWRAMRNRYWPAFYLLDKQGIVRAVYIGETHSGGSQARRIAVAIGRLLKEPDPNAARDDPHVGLNLVTE